jgi:hypothetical protein
MELYDMDSAGLFGVVTETGTTAVTGNFAQILCLTATTFSLFTETNGSGDAMTGVAIPAGTLIKGRITAFTLTSGAVRAHRAGSPQGS